MIKKLSKPRKCNTHYYRFSEGYEYQVSWSLLLGSKCKTYWFYESTEKTCKGEFLFCIDSRKAFFDIVLAYHNDQDWKNLVQLERIKEQMIKDEKRAERTIQLLGKR